MGEIISAFYGPLCIKHTGAWKTQRQARWWLMIEWMQCTSVGGTHWRVRHYALTNHWSVTNDSTQSSDGDIASLLPSNQPAGRLINCFKALSAAAAVGQAWMTDDLDISSVRHGWLVSCQLPSLHPPSIHYSQLQQLPPVSSAVACLLYTSPSPRD